MFERNIKDQIDEFLETFQEYSGEDKSSLAERICFEVANIASHNHYEALGILEEAKLQFREISLETMAEECNCDECKKEREEAGDNEED